MTDVTGRRSETEGSEGIREIWVRARQVPQSPAGGTWVPWRTIKVDYRILPRASETPNADIVRQYVETLDELPPITVQMETFTLIDGLHRLTAAAEASTDFVRIVEDPVSDAELWIAAFEANALHGHALTTAERVRAAKHRIKESDWSDALIAKWAGVHRNSVMQWRQKMTAAEGGSPLAQNVQPESESERRVGVDGKSYPATKPVKSQGGQVAQNVQPESETPPTNGHVGNVAPAKTKVAAAPKPSSDELFTQYRRRFIDEVVEMLQQAESEHEWRSALLVVGGKCANEAVR